MSGAQFADHFSAVASRYAQFRPGYPDDLFERLAASAPGRALAWEAGCGSGQATVSLARHFDQVIATEPSASQLAHAPPLANVEYRCEPAESSSLEGQSVDLAVVAQAMHWFDLSRYFAELERVLKPGGLFASWCYQDFIPDPRIREPVLAFRSRIAEYWPPERALVDEGYASVAFPFRGVADHRFEVETAWPLAHLMGYLRSQSAVKRCIEAQGEDPVAALESELAPSAGDAFEVQLRWPMRLHVRCRD